MESVHKKLDERDLRYFKFVFGRAQNVADEQLVKELGDPEIDSPQVLYRRLIADGYPVCFECGDTPVQTTTCEACSEKRRHRARTSGDKVELPAAARAKELLREPVEGL